MTAKIIPFRMPGQAGAPHEPDPPPTREDALIFLQDQLRDHTETNELFVLFKAGADWRYLNLEIGLSELDRLLKQVQLQLLKAAFDNFTPLTPEELSRLPVHEPDERLDER